MHLVYICTVDDNLSDWKLRGVINTFEPVTNRIFGSILIKSMALQGLHKSSIKHLIAKVSNAEAELNKKVGDLNLEIEHLQKHKE